jgi:hypothetical protein
MIQRGAWMALLIVGAVLLPARVGAQESSGITLTIRTIPRLEGVRFVVAGTVLKSNEEGIATITVPAAGTYRLRVPSPSLVDSTRRVELARWSDGVEGRKRPVSISAPTELQVGFDVSYLVSERLLSSEGEPVDSALVDSLTIVDEEGRRLTVPGHTEGLQGPTALLWQRHPAGTRWLVGSRIQGSDGAMSSGAVPYRVVGATSGGHPIDATSADFYPADSDTWPVTLSATEVVFAVRGLLASPGPSTLSVASQDGWVRKLPEGEEQAALLAPGSYLAVAHATGLPLRSEFSVPGTKRVTVTVLGPADVAVTALALGALAALLWRKRMRGAPRIPAPIPSRAFAAEPEEQARQLVRIRLDTGRIIEGWVREEGFGRGVLILDVARVRDGAGRDATPVGSDFFVPHEQIDQLEHLGPDQATRSLDAEEKAPERHPARRDSGEVGTRGATGQSAP